MHAQAFLHSQLRAEQIVNHQTRLQTLTLSVSALLNCHVLQLTAIGRSLAIPAYDKHAIKRVDRLLGNTELARERVALYRWLAKRLIRNKIHPVILIDYSDVDACRTRVILRAAIPVAGRSLVLYEEVHDHDSYPPYWQQFLNTLRSLLPPACRPILVTDAGFRGPWREVVTAMGWYYVMRQRNRDLFHTASDPRWRPCKTLYRSASATPKAVGTIILNRSRPCQVNAYLYKGEPQKRQRFTALGTVSQSRHSLKNADREREPWLLLSNLPPQRRLAKKVIAIFRTRMQIEESFRDLKSHRFGFAFKGNRCTDVLRLQNLLLIAALAHFLVWLIGLYAEAKQLHYALQANTERRRRVLSICQIGLIMHRKQLHMRRDDWGDAMTKLHSATSSCY